MDTLYIGDIPSQFHYAVFNNGYIDLYDRETLHNGTFNSYRVFTNVNGFYYEPRTVTVGQYSTTYTRNINVSDKPVYRTDFPSILFITCVFTIFGVWLFNLLSSLIRKGGVLGGLF